MYSFPLLHTQGKRCCCSMCTREYDTIFSLAQENECDPNCLLGEGMNGERNTEGPARARSWEGYHTVKHWNEVINPF